MLPKAKSDLTGHVGHSQTMSDGTSLVPYGIQVTTREHRPEKWSTSDAER
jgi:hypothetical protein